MESSSPSLATSEQPQQDQNNLSKISKGSLKRFALNAVIAPCCEGSVSGNMDSRAKLIATLSAFALFCLLIATLPIGADTSDRNRTTHDEIDAALFCSGASNTSEPTFYSEMAKVNAHMHEGMKIGPAGDIDRDFMRMMIPHHQGAIDMALLQLKYGHDEKIKRLAQSIIVEQGQEIAYMRTLLNTPAGPTTIRPTAEQ